MSKLTKQTLQSLLKAHIIRHVIHDLNNPLGSISLLLELQQEILSVERADTSIIMKQSEQMANSIQKGSQIAHAFQSFTDEGDSEVNLFNIADSIDQFLIFMSSYFRKNSIEIKRAFEALMIECVEADLNTLIFYILINIAKQAENSCQIMITGEQGKLHFKCSKHISGMTDFYSNDLHLPNAQVEQIINTILTDNNFELSYDNATFSVTY
jgi:signal transduction histidine kinase